MTINKENLDIIEKGLQQARDLEHQDMLKDIKLLLLRDTAFNNDWGYESSWEHDKEFIAIANKYGITINNILDGLNQKELESLKDMSLDDEVREELERRLKNA